ncbi:MAG TPA: HDOD domain-containing protein [Candidatus Acidoferrales bacterium]|nr:HDOD domain-containing protein [Candidatus Acidoferrales bacterium]
MHKFIARQPIFTADRKTYGYELLGRSGLENLFISSNPDQAAASTIDNVLLFGIDRLTQGHRAFLNCTRDFLVRDFGSVLPKDNVVIEVLETVRLDAEVIEACRRLKQSGYLIALDDFQDLPEWKPLVALADFIKVDVLATSPEEQLRLSLEFASANVRLVAEKVETYDVFERCRGWNYELFQGYFFCRPQMLTRNDIPANKLNYLRVLQAVHKDPVDMREVAENIKLEASLSYRLLRYLNSPIFFLPVEIHSIPHALSLLGERGARKWVSLVVIACMGEDKPQELMMLPLVRARFCESLAPLAAMDGSANDLFLLGLLSAVDAILDMKMKDVLDEISIRAEIREALLGKSNKFRDVFEVVLAYEIGDWSRMESAAAHCRMILETVPTLFMQSLEWANAIITGHPVEEIKNA